MKKLLILVAFLMLASLTAFAVTREFLYSEGNTNSNATKFVNQDGQTNFQTVGAAGTTKTGNAGYVALMAMDDAGHFTPYYLWVDGSAGKLCMASYSTITTYASFPSGDWRSTSGMNCVKVSSQ